MLTAWDRPCYAWILQFEQVYPQRDDRGICSICSNRFTLRGSTGGHCGVMITIPHADDPGSAHFVIDSVVYPHARIDLQCQICKGRRVYPACAGIDLEPDKQMKGELGLPRMRGDRPRPSPGPASHSPFTPHARGSTARYHYRQHPMGVYPACAGIDRCCA